MEKLILLLAGYSLAFLIKETSLFQLVRVFFLKFSGRFGYGLLSCYYCLGFHTSNIIYLLANKSWNIRDIIIWGLTGGMFSYMMDRLVHYEKE